MGSDCTVYLSNGKSHHFTKPAGYIANALDRST